MSKRNQSLMLVAPLLLFLLVAYFAPLGSMIIRSVYDPVVADIFPETTGLLSGWDGAALPDEAVFSAMAMELQQARRDKTLGRAARSVNRIQSGARSLFSRTARKLGQVQATTDWQKAMIDIHPDWGNRDIWQVIKYAGEKLTWRYYLNALDLTRDNAGNIVAQPAEKRIYITLIMRTLLVSLAVTLLCLMLGYPLAYLIANSSSRRAGVLLLLVLMPFWTSLLVRTTSWIVILQQQGVINDLFVSLGLIDDQNRVAMIYNMTGNLIAMTHILLPFMVLPLYSVMRTIPPLHMKAAASLGAGFWQSFRQVYWPQSLPGVGGGVLLVFILSIGYYITPALVGGQSGQLISNLIAYHVQQSLNWGLAAALGTILLVGVKLLYLAYERVAGSDRIKLG